MINQGQALYESEDFQQFSGGAMRPGGLALTRQALEAAQLIPGARVLDLGCGLGTTVNFLVRQGYVAAGLDASLPLVERARQRYPGLDLRHGNAGAISWEDAHFDAVLCECTFSLFPNQDAALDEIARVLATGGLLMICDFYLRDDDVNDLPTDTCLAGAQSRTGLTALMKAHGFTPRLWQDAADHLRQFTAQMVWEYGSLDAFWQAFSLTGAPMAKPGYALSIWEKA